MPILKIAACQVPDIRMDVEASLRCLEEVAEAVTEDINILLFPEGFLQGYLTEDEQVRRFAIDLSSSDFAAILARVRDIQPMLVFGLIEMEGTSFYNSAVVVYRGELQGVYRKVHLLPGESVFTPGNTYPIFELNGIGFGINVCYDMQFTEAAIAVADQGAVVILCPANNMMRCENAEKWKYRHHEMRIERAKEADLWVVSADVTGERDGRIGYGPTSVISPGGEVIDQVPLLTTGFVVAEVTT